MPRGIATHKQIEYPVSILQRLSAVSPHCRPEAGESTYMDAEFTVNKYLSLVTACCIELSMISLLSRKKACCGHSFIGRFGDSSILVLHVHV